MSDFRDLLLAAGALSLLGGCVVQERVYAPPPRVYAPPPQVYAPPPQPVVTAEVELRVSEPPPPLPDYDQPPIPEPGYLWTPGYWGWGGGVYVFHAGYWGPHVGFYGGVNYGGGYVGAGFVGGRWVNNGFAYNTAVTNVNVNIVHNTYNETVINTVTVNKVSYNGGAGGTVAAPTATEQMAAREPHVAPPAAQMQHVQEAAHNRALLARVNQGRPAIAATPRPGAFNAPTVVPARAAAFDAHNGRGPGGAVPGAPPVNAAGAAAGQAHGAGHPNSQPPPKKPPPKKPPEEKRRDQERS